MLRIFAILEMTFKKVKEPAFSLLFVIAAVMGYFVSDMSALSINNNDGVLFGLITLEQGHCLLTGFVIIFFVTSIIAIFSGATDIPKDIDSRMIMLVLGKPINRLEYLIGKYCGNIAICVLFYLVATISACITQVSLTGKMYDASVLVRQLLLLLAIFPFTAMTMMISTFFSDITAMIIASAYLALSLFFSSISIFVDMLPKSLSTVSIVHLIAYFFPNYFYFFNSFKFSGIVIVALTVYSLSITVIFLSIAATRLNSRDLT